MFEPKYTEDDYQWYEKYGDFINEAFYRTHAEISEYNNYHNINTYFIHVS